ncbi:ABC transporter ATP-binding protein [Chondromyces apiculatus]|uniref:Oligopeptide transport ATP-binding protein OppD n=1 Tax=Chondromyces apiculatus DSM 436 TaxID=1192034 RepID=A0A017SX26_9BACT|nr:ABC transporter ATP-binding protein [Chondromyces apiculatus]EYF01509.1 Oligopeptide transport ATP-binding protein OppD [Chondromyces apiculatus DSM 436]
MLFEVKDLHTQFSTEEGVVRAVDGISFSVDRGEVLGIVGESGSGKSVTSLSILKLIPDPPGRITGGQILLETEAGKTEDLVRASEARMEQIRGDRIAMIFQDPMTSLNPYLRIGAQLAEVLVLHKRMRRAEARARSIALLKEVGIPAATSRIDDYPHQLSGGMRQRVMIAMALLCDPDLLIADEPTTALDVTIQAQILDLIQERREAQGVAVILITHDLGVVARMADRVAVMYAGRIVEEASAEAIFHAPRHPYTIGLKRSVPRLDVARGQRLSPIPGMPPSLARVPPGCPFHPRCEHVMAVCREKVPETREVSREASAGEPGEGKSAAGDAAAGATKATRRALHVVRCHLGDPALDTYHGHPTSPAPEAQQVDQPGGGAS